MPRELQDELDVPVHWRSRATEAFLAILRTAAVLDHQIDEALRPHRSGLTQYNVLRVLAGAGSAGLCGRQVAERLVARVPDVPRLLKRLETRGLIARERDAADRRHVTARLTPKGRHLVRAAGPRLEAILRSRLNRLSARTMLGLIDGLAAVRDGT